MYIRNIIRLFSNIPTVQMHPMCYKEANDTIKVS